MVKIATSLVKELRERTGLGMMECKRALVDTNGNIQQAIDELRKTSGLKAAKKAGRTAADGVIGVKVIDNYGVICEINSETDFVARDENFSSFVEIVLSTAFDKKNTDFKSLFLEENLEGQRQALIQKIGENIMPRRASSIEAPMIGSYLHSNNKIGVLVGMRGDDPELAQNVAMHIAAVNPVVVESKDMPSEVLAAEEKIYAAQANETGKPEKIIEKMVSGWQVGQTLHYGSNYITDISSHGLDMLTAESSGLLKLWSTHSKNQTSDTLYGKTEIMDAIFGPSDDKIAVAFENGEIKISIYRVKKEEVLIKKRKDTQLSDQEGAVILFSDNGCGIPHEVGEKIFDPFFTFICANKCRAKNLTCLCCLFNKIFHDINYFFIMDISMYSHAC